MRMLRIRSAREMPILTAASLSLSEWLLGILTQSNLIGSLFIWEGGENRRLGDVLRPLCLKLALRGSVDVRIGK